MALIFIVCVSMMVALSPVITMGDQVVLEVHFPQWIIDKWSIFRASGRIMWSAVYVIMFVSCIVILKILDKRMMVAVLSVALAIQIYDLSDILKGKKENFSNIKEYISRLTNDCFWNHIAKNDTIQHIVYFSMVDESMMYSITDWAMQHKKTVNDFYFARSLGDKILGSRTEALRSLTDDTLYIFNEYECLDTLQYDLHYYKIDGLIVGYCNEIWGFEEIIDNDIALNWNFADNLYLSENGGMDTENGREIYSGGLSYGPYLSVPRGNYAITILGEDMPKEGIDIIIYSKYGKQYHDFQVISQGASEIKLYISLDEDVENLEVCIKNNTQRIVLIKSLEIRYVE